MVRELSLEERAKSKLHHANGFAGTNLIVVKNNERAYEFYILLKEIFNEGFEYGAKKTEIGAEIKKQIQAKIDEYEAQIKLNERNAILEYEGKL